MQDLSYYEILEVSQSADKTTIKKAYRAMAKKYKKSAAEKQAGKSAANTPKKLSNKDYEKELERLGAKVHLATEDGSRGHRGLVSELLEETVENESLSGSDIRIFACGPVPMLKTVADIARRYSIPGYVSLEEKMACGIGACLGCACRVIAPNGQIEYRMVCTDGPVFGAGEIVWT